MNPKEIVDLFRYLWCGRWTICEKGNHHPWCSCGYDQFDWSGPYQDITREAAEWLIRREHE